MLKSFSVRSARKSAAADSEEPGPSAVAGEKRTKAKAKAKAKKTTRKRTGGPKQKRDLELAKKAQPAVKSSKGSPGYANERSRSQIQCRRNPLASWGGPNFAIKYGDGTSLSEKQALDKAVRWKKLAKAAV